MYTIKTLNAISPVGLAKLPATQFEVDNDCAAPHGILVRSADMHEMEFHKDEPGTCRRALHIRGSVLPCPMRNEARVLS